MKHAFAIVVLTAFLCTGAKAANERSEYTSFDSELDCTVIGQSADGDGDWADLVCRGFANYPFTLRYGDARETITYGFASGFGMAGFAPFSSANKTIEWRIRDDRGASAPFATIQRWFVAKPEGAGDNLDVLVVSRVGQPGDGQGCAIAYILATGNAGANEEARLIADEKASGFDCLNGSPEIDPLLEGIVVTR